jgi:hypothetical protein
MPSGRDFNRIKSGVRWLKSVTGSHYEGLKSSIEGDQFPPESALQNHEMAVEPRIQISEAGSFVE